jgi:TPR repeat protein
MLRRFGKFSGTILFAALMAAAAHAGPGNYNQAMEAYYKDDFVTAARLLHVLAERGNINAQRELGRMYAKGEGAPKDEAEAKRLFKLASEQEDALKSYNTGDFAKALQVFRPLAEKGQALAEYILGLAYTNAQGVSENYPEGLKWLQKAGEQGEAKAQFAVGVAYFKGLGVQKDYGEAFKWYRRAADQGLGVAQYNLGAMYAKGEAVTQDVVTAHLLYGLAATSGIKAAGAAKNQLAKTMTPEQIAQAEKMAKDWKPKLEDN